MDRFDIRRVAMGLTAYAIERQHSYERHQPEGAPPWAEQRRLWTDAILQGMARLDGLEPDPKLMEQFDRELEQARGCYFTVPTTQQMQKDTIRELRRFVATLEATGDDRRRQVNVVRELLEDMSLHPHWWNGKNNSIDLARDEADRALVRMTAQMPIRFTYIALGGDAGPHWASGFASGSVTDEEAVKKTTVYQETIRKYPEVAEWPALCTVYAGRGLSTALGTVDASDFDLEIMNRIGDRFLDERGVRWLGGPYQMAVQTAGQKAVQYPFLQGSRPLTAGDLDVQERTGTENGWITFCLDVLACEEAIFGRQLSCEEEDSYIQAYTSYNEHTGQVDDTLDVVVRSPGGDAQYALGKLYLLGKDVPQDRESAVRWFTLAAEQGNEYARFFLDHMDDSPSLFASTTRLLHHMGRIFQEQAPPPGGGISFVDSKLRRKIREKKIAMGHKPDDHEEQAQQFR